MSFSSTFCQNQQQQQQTILILFFLLGLISNITNASIVSDNSIILRFTARDFLPAGCFHNYSDLVEIWDYTKFANATPYGFTSPESAPIYPPIDDPNTNTRFRGTDPVYCPLWRDIQDGVLDGHPDFEVGRYVYAQGCSGYNDFTTLPENGGMSCIDKVYGPAWGNLSKIVEDYLVEDEAGIPKLVYCKNPKFAAYGDMRCGSLESNNTYPRLAATAGREYFEYWYTDEPKYNMRVGFKLELGRNETTGQYIFSSGVASYFSPEGGSFHPLNQFANVEPCEAIDGRLNCDNGGKIFPLSAMALADERPENHSYSFTVEGHFFFDFEGNETFAFSGDDDFWVFINGKLAVDVGGFHGPIMSKIDLSVPAVREYLELEVGGIYALDIFHAERKTSGSNFALETTFRPKCNVLQAGQRSYYFNVSSLEEDWKLVGGPTWGIVDSGAILLTDANEKNTAVYAFLKQQINIGTGFVAEFEFTASSQKGEGFVFVIQRDSIVNKNGGSGGHLGFRNTLDSIGIVFDFCADRDANPINPSCSAQELRMHVAEVNNASSATRLLRAPLLFTNKVNDGRPHRVTVRYFSTPAWIEVLIDDDLFMQRRDFNLVNILGGRNAFVGFTGSTGQAAASTVRITDLVVKTVAVKDGNTVLNATQSGEIVANGRDVYTARLSTFDFCNRRIQFGGFSQRAGAVLVSQDDPTFILEPLNVVDADDGVYRLEFAHKEGNGTFDLRVWFGSDPNTCNKETASSTEDCFVSSLDSAAVFVLPPPDETLDSVETLSLAQQLFLGLGATAGSVFIIGVCAVIYVLPARKKWQRDKRFIEKGRLAALEKNVVYEGDYQIEITAQRLQRVLESLSRARANRYYQDQIDELLVEQGELEESIRIIKAQRAELIRQKSKLALQSPESPESNPRSASSTDRPKSRSFRNRLGFLSNSNRSIRSPESPGSQERNASSSEQPKSFRTRLPFFSQ